MVRSPSFRGSRASPARSRTRSGINGGEDDLAEGPLANGRVRRVAHESTTPETLAQSIQRPLGIALNGRVLFVASAGTSAASYADGAIIRVTLP